MNYKTEMSEANKMPEENSESGQIKPYKTLNILHVQCVPAVWA